MKNMDASIQMSKFWTRVEDPPPKLREDYNGSGKVIVAYKTADQWIVTTSELIRYKHKNGNEELVWEGRTPDFWMPLPHHPF